MFPIRSARRWSTASSAARFPPCWAAANMRPAALPSIPTSCANPKTQACAPAHPVDLTQSLATLESGLRAELESGKIGLKLEGRGLIISLRESAFFASGDDGVATAGQPIMAKIAGVIRGPAEPGAPGRAYRLPSDSQLPLPQQLGIIGGASHRDARAARRSAITFRGPAWR